MKAPCYKLVLVAIIATLFFTSCNNGLPLQHAADCKFKTTEALAQSLALCLRDADFTCAQNYLPGISNVLTMKSTNEGDGDLDNFGDKADHILVKALKDEITKLRDEITAKGGDVSKLKLLSVTESMDQSVVKLTMHLQAGSIKFTIKPVGLFNSEGSWYLLGSRFTTTFE